MKYFGILFLLIGSQVFSQEKESIFKIGDKAPIFEGKDQYGNNLSSEEILSSGEQILLVFYRGYWCPYCQNHLKELDETFKEFGNKGVRVVVVSPEKPEKINETSEKLKNEIPLIFDDNNIIMTQFGVAFELDSTDSSWIRKRVNKYNAPLNNVLPVPATFLIDSTGRIQYLQYDPDYSKRSNLEGLLETI